MQLKLKDLTSGTLSKYRMVNYKIIITLFCFLMVFSSCEFEMERYVRVCTCEDYRKISSFVENSIGKANNMSDEEMEDVIRELELTGIRNNCEGRSVKFIMQEGEIVRFISKLDSCETVEKMQ